VHLPGLLLGLRSVSAGWLLASLPCVRPARSKQSKPSQRPSHLVASLSARPVGWLSSWQPASVRSGRAAAHAGGGSPCAASAQKKPVVKKVVRTAAVCLDRVRLASHFVLHVTPSPVRSSARSERNALFAWWRSRSTLARVSAAHKPHACVPLADEHQLALCVAKAGWITGWQHAKPGRAAHHAQDGGAAASPRRTRFCRRHLKSGGLGLGD